MIIILKKIILIISLLFLMIPYFSIISYAETSDNDTSYDNSEQESDESNYESNKSEGVSFSFTFLGHEYTFNILFLDSVMPTVRDIIFYFLLAKSIFIKFKALPAIIGQVPVIGPSDSQQVAMYNNRYGR